MIKHIYTYLSIWCGFMNAMFYATWIIISKQSGVMGIIWRAFYRSEIGLLKAIYGYVWENWRKYILIKEE